MKTSKRILKLIVSLTATALISAGLSGGLYLFLGTGFLGGFIFFFAAQILGFFLYDRYIESRNITSLLKEYVQKPFREYSVTLPCQFCGRQQDVPLIFDDLEFECQNCKGKNAIHIEFRTAAISKYSQQ